MKRQYRKRAEIVCSSCSRTAPLGGRGLCRTCYARRWREGNFGERWTPDYERLFWEKVEFPGDSRDCWLWRGGKFRGYGQAQDKNGKILAHRFSWQLHYGPIPEGLFVCHWCDVPCCVNPDHLFLGTHTDNMRDMEAKGRTKIQGSRCIPITDGSLCSRGHRFTHYDNRGWKKCRTCEREFGMAYRERQRAMA